MTDNTNPIQPNTNTEETLVDINGASIDVITEESNGASVVEVAPEEVTAPSEAIDTPAAAPEVVITEDDIVPQA